MRFGRNADCPTLSCPATLRGTRNFFPDGWTPTRNEREAIAAFPNAPDIQEVEEWCEENRQRMPTGFEGIHPRCMLILRTWTLESPVFELLCEACRTETVDSRRRIETQYGDFLHYLDTAISSLPAVPGAVYRGINRRLPADTYPLNQVVTWASPSGASRSPLAALQFVEDRVLALHGTLFVVQSVTGKDISAVSKYPAEQEVFFKTNSHFRVVEVIQSGDDRANLRKRRLVDAFANPPPPPEPGCNLGHANISELDVIVLQQI